MMDIEKLIEQLRWWAENCDRSNYGCHARPFLLDAAAALSTLQTENAQLRESRDHWKRLAHELSEGVNGKEAEHERLQAENEKLRTELDDLRIQWDMYGGDMGITAVYKELEQVKRERDAIEQDFRAFAKQWWEQDSGFPCRWCKFENSGGCEWKAKQPNEEKICAGRAFEWRGPQKED